MYIEITTALGCPNNCSFCPQKTLLSAYFKPISRLPKSLMSFSSFKSYIEKLPKKAVISFSGMCEPFKNPSCTKMILYAHETGHKIYIFTTMVGLSLKDAHRIFHKIPFKTRISYVSIHLPSEENIEKILVTAEYLEVLKFIISTGATIDFHYHGQQLHHKVSPLFTNTKYVLNQYTPMDRAGNLNLPETVRPEKPVSGKITCSKLEQHGHVLFPDGRVILCCMDYGLTHVLGNLKESSYSAIRKSKELQKVEQAMNDDSIELFCRGCTYAVEVSESNDTNLLRRFYMKLRNWGNKVF